MPNNSSQKGIPSDVIHSVSDIMDDPQLAPFADEIAAMLDNQDRVLPLRSYLLAQQDHLSQKIEQIRKTNPGMPLKKVVTKLLQDLPEQISSEMLLLLTRFIISTWENTGKKEVKVQAS